MKEITEVLKAAYHWGRDNGKGRSDKNFNDFLNTSVVSKLEFFVNQEVEKRIAERMPSEEEIMRRVRNRKDYLRELGYPTQVLVKYGDAIIETIEWLRSRLTPQVTPQDTHQVQKTEGGTE